MNKPAMDEFARPIRQFLPQWAGEEMRINPYKLPMRANIGSDGDFSFVVNRDGAVVRRRLACGLAATISLPARVFSGVAARAYEADDGTVTVTLELHHTDPQLCVPLLVSDDLDDIAADWHSWSRILQLPMLIIESDSTARPLCDQLGTIMVEKPVARRKRITAPRHRPNFLRRRKTGMVSNIVRISGQELVARA
jgi:hypothetical protein